MAVFDCGGESMISQSPTASRTPIATGLIPDWRKGAGPGQTLAQVKAANSKPPASQNAGGTPAQPAAGTAALPAAQPPRELRLLIRPNVRDRWLASQISYFTPTIVENTARGAMAGNLLAQWLMFDLMEQTWPRLSKNLNELKNAVIDMEWNLKPFAMPGDKPSAEAQRRQKIIEQAIWLMKPEPDADEADFEDTIFDVMDAVGKGIEVSEIDWMEPGDPLNQTGLWMPRATRWVHPRYYGYPPQPGTEDRLMLNLMEVRMANPEIADALKPAFDSWGVQGALGPVGVLNGLYARFPRDQFIISIFKQKSGHPISSALLRILGFWWSAQNFSWEWFLNLAQIFGVPLRWTTVAKDAPPDTILQVETMMANLGSSAWAVFPEGTKIEVQKALETARDNPAKAFIDAADIICDTIILGQTLTTTQGERGSQSLGVIHKTVRDEKVQAVAKRTAKTLNNQFLPSICRLNFGDDSECPYFSPAAKGGKNLTDTATRWKTVLSIPGVEVSRQQFLEENELIEPDNDDDVLVGQAGGGPGGPGGSGSDTNDPGDETPTRAVGRGASGALSVAKAKATDEVINRALEDLTGVERKWLAGVVPVFRSLVALAKDGKVSDAEFVKSLERARKHMPELFGTLDAKALADALEHAMGAAAVNGAVRGFMGRGRGGARG